MNCPFELRVTYSCHSTVFCPSLSNVVRAIVRIFVLVYYRYRVFTTEEKYSDHDPVVYIIEYYWYIFLCDEDQEDFAVLLIDNWIHLMKKCHKQYHRCEL